MCRTETFSSTLTSEEQNSGMGGIALLTLSDTENNLHFILILQGLVKHQDKGERGATEEGRGPVKGNTLASPPLAPHTLLISPMKTDSISV